MPHDPVPVRITHHVRQRLDRVWTELLQLDPAMIVLPDTEFDALRNTQLGAVRTIATPPHRMVLSNDPALGTTTLPIVLAIALLSDVKALLVMARARQTDANRGLAVTPLALARRTVDHAEHFILSTQVAELRPQKGSHPHAALAS